MNYSFHAAAEAELKDAVDYYDACRTHLGWEFAEEVYTAIQNILAHLAAWTDLSKRTRRCLIRRFPYGVIYQVTGDEIRIIAIMHLNRRPVYWHGRTGTQGAFSTRASGQDVITIILLSPCMV